MTETLRPALSILTSGAGDDRRVSPLSSLADIEILSYKEDEADARSRNSLLARATHNWVLLLHEAESVTAPLAREIVQVTRSAAQAWAFRVSLVRYYRDRPLRLGVTGAEIRLIQRRHCRFDERSTLGELRVEGPVIRLRNVLRVNTFASSEEQRSALSRTAVPHSFLRRLLIFSSEAVRSGALFLSPNTLRYLWIEAAFDQEGRKLTNDE